MKKIKIIIADDHAILLDGLKAVIQTDEQFQIIGDAEDGEKVVALVNSLKPDVVILDINMPKLNGVEAARKIRSKNHDVKILMLTMYENESFITDAISAGVNGYIFKMCDMEELLKAVHSIVEGKDYFHEKVSKVVFSNYVKNAKKTYYDDDPGKISLTKREREILKLIIAGYTSHEIAEKLFISYFTVGEHRKNIMKKLEVKNTAELVSIAVKENLI
jgi:DNA-binding NarL/FixJ family response regulator